MYAYDYINKLFMLVLKRTWKARKNSPTKQCTLTCVQVTTNNSIKDCN